MWEQVKTNKNQRMRTMALKEVQRTVQMHAIVTSREMEGL